MRTFKFTMIQRDDLSSGVISISCSFTSVTRNQSLTVSQKKFKVASISLKKTLDSVLAASSCNYWLCAFWASTKLRNRFVISVNLTLTSSELLTSFKRSSISLRFAVMLDNTPLFFLKTRTRSPRTPSLSIVTFGLGTRALDRTAGGPELEG